MKMINCAVLQAVKTNVTYSASKEEQHQLFQRISKHNVRKCLSDLRQYPVVVMIVTYSLKTSSSGSWTLTYHWDSYSS